METKITFEEYLRKENLSENTITSYLWTVNYFNVNYDVVSKENLLAYKGYGERITTRGISQQLKNYAEKYGLDKKVVYPHSFRHRYAKNFLEKYNDIALLADLMGHESIETTRIYLRRTASEQQELVDKIVTW